MTLSLEAVEWPEIGPGDDLAALVAAIDGLQDGDVVVVTSKVVSKAEGRLVHEDRGAAIEAETRRVVARRGATVIAETRHGLVMAAAGVDASNTPSGTALLLPLDPDGSARALRSSVRAMTGLNVGVVVTDTAGRAWRLGQTDLCVGCAGLPPLVDLEGTRDTHGNVLHVTAPAIADEVAGAADLVKGKATGRPVAVVRGLARLVLPAGEDGPGAAALVRTAAEDLFAHGSREAAVAAARRDDPAALRHFPTWTPADPDPFVGLLAGWPRLSADAHVVLTSDGYAQAAHSGGRAWTLRVAVPDGCDRATLLAVGRLLERADTLAAAARLSPHPCQPDVDADGVADPAGWHRVASTCWHDS